MNYKELYENDTPMGIYRINPESSLVVYRIIQYTADYEPLNYMTSIYTNGEYANFRLRRRHWDETRQEEYINIGKSRIYLTLENEVR